MGPILVLLTPSAFPSSSKRASDILHARIRASIHRPGRAHSPPISRRKAPRRSLGRRAPSTPPRYGNDAVPERVPLAWRAQIFSRAMGMCGQAGTAKATCFGAWEGDVRMASLGGGAPNVASLQSLIAPSKVHATYSLAANGGPLDVEDGAKTPGLGSCPETR